MQGTAMAEKPAQYTILIHRAEEGGFWAEVEELPGCVSQGETIEEVNANILEALEAILDSRVEAVSWRTVAQVAQ